MNRRAGSGRDLTAVPTVPSGGMVAAVARLITRVAAWTLPAALLGAIAVFVVLPTVIGGQALTVETGSMAPALPVGCIVVERPADPGTLHVGDIATYRLADGRGLVTHRIAAIGTGHRHFLFRGDANPVDDAVPVPAAAITGRVWFTVPYAGLVRAQLGRSRELLIVLAVLGLGTYCVGRFTGRRRTTAWAASSTARRAPRPAAARTARRARARAR